MEINGLSVVIGAYHNEEGTYLSLFSIINQLKQQPSLWWEVIIVADAGTEWKYEKLPKVRVIRLTGSNRSGSPQGTRDAGIRAAKYKTVLSIENHVTVSHPELWYWEHHRMGATLSFVPRMAEGPEMYNVYGSTTDWDKTLWYKRLIYSPISDSPYRICQFGHSAFIIDRDWYIQNGGYTNLLSGWGHEEQFLALKVWMLGGSCWMIPSVNQAHFLSIGAHGDSLGSEQFERNWKIGRFVLTGERPQGLIITPAMQAERDRICSGPFQGNIDKLKEHFKNEGIVN